MVITWQLSAVMSVIFVKNSDGFPIWPAVAFQMALELQSKSKAIETLHDLFVNLLIIGPPSK